MPRETVLPGFTSPPPNAVAISGLLSIPSPVTSWVYFRVRNNSATANVFIIGILVARSDGLDAIPLRIETNQGNPVDSAGSIRWLDLGRAGTPNVTGGSAIQTSYPFAGLTTATQERGRLMVGAEPQMIQFPLVLPPSTNFLIHTMSRGSFWAHIYFFSPE